MLIDFSKLAEFTKIATPRAEKMGFRGMHSAFGGGYAPPKLSML